MPARPERDYSQVPLGHKLGIRDGSRVAILAEGVEHPPSAGLDVIVFFATTFGAVKDRFPALAGQLAAAGGLWIAYPKRHSGIESDLSQDGVRDIGLAAGLVDNKICVIDDRWSAVRFVTRLKDRPARPESRRGP